MITTIAGMTLGVTPTLPTSLAPIDFASLTFNNIGYMSELGEYGVEYNVIKFKPIATRKTIKVKSFFDYGTNTIELAFDPQDGGVAILREALNSNNEYSFRISYNDDVVEYFLAKVTKIKRSSGSITSMRMLSIDLNITELLDTDDGSNILFMVSGSDFLVSDSDFLISA